MRAGREGKEGRKGGGGGGERREGVQALKHPQAANPLVSVEATCTKAAHLIHTITPAMKFELLQINH